MAKRENLSSLQMIPIPEEEAPEADTLQNKQRAENKRLILVILAVSGLALALALLCVLFTRPARLISGPSPRTKTLTSQMSASTPSPETPTSKVVSVIYLPVIFQSTSVGATETTPPNGAIPGTISTAAQIPVPSSMPGAGSAFHIMIATHKVTSV